MPAKCRQCGRECRVPQVVDMLRRERHRSKKTGRLLRERTVPRKATLCGYCYALEWAMSETEEPMNSQLYEDLLALARAETNGSATGQVDSNGAKRTEAMNNGSKGRVSRNGNGRKAMSADEATNFDRISEKNAALVEGLRVCDCVAYVDILTYGRWQASGFQVRCGEKGTRGCFCRCQVDAIRQAVAA